MMTRTKFIAAGVLGALLITSAPPPAEAARLVIDTGVRRNTARTVNEIRDLRNDVRTQSRILIEALRMQTGEQSAYADKQIEALKRIQDASNQNATDLVRQEIRAKAESGEFDPDPNFCLLMDLFRGGDSGGSASSGPLNGTRIVDRARGEAEVIGANGAAAAAGTMANRTVNINGHDASVRAGTYLEAPTVDLSDEALAQAATDFFLYLNDPLPMQVVTPEEAEADVEKAVQRAMQRSRLARSSVIDQNWAMTQNMSTPTTPKANVQGLIDGIGEENYGRALPDKLSELQVLDLRVLSHYLPGPMNSGTETPGQTLQKIHQLLSIMARMQYMQLEMDRRDMMTTSTILAKMIEKDGNAP